MDCILNIILSRDNQRQHSHQNPTCDLQKKDDIKDVAYKICRTTSSHQNILKAHAECVNIAEHLVQKINSKINQLEVKDQEL